MNATMATSATATKVAYSNPSNMMMRRSLGWIGDSLSRSRLLKVTRRGEECRVSKQVRSTLLMGVVMAVVLMREARSEQANERMKQPRSIDGGYHSSTAAVTLGWVVVRPHSLIDIRYGG